MMDLIEKAKSYYRAYERHDPAFVAAELADGHRRLAAVDKDHDAVVAIAAEFRFGAQHRHRAVRDSVRGAELNPAELQDRDVAVKFPAGDDAHLER